MENLEQLEHFVNIGLALARQTDRTVLLEQILQSAQHISQADGGTIYRLTSDNSLEFATLFNRSLGLHQGGSSGQSPALAPIPLYTAGKPNDSAVVALAAVQKQPFVIDDVYLSPLVNQQKAREFDQQLGYRTQSMLTVPLLDHQGDVTGVLQLVNCLDSAGQVQAFSAETQRLVIALSSMAAMVLTNKQLVLDLEELFGALSRLLAKAIDETNRRRAKQVAYNLERGVDPQPLRKKIADITDLITRESEDTEELLAHEKGGAKKVAASAGIYDKSSTSLPRKDLIALIGSLTEQMRNAASELQFEVAARLRDEIKILKKELRMMEEAGV